MYVALVYSTPTPLIISSREGVCSLDDNIKELVPISGLEA
jgi:hypothetical protein